MAAFVFSALGCGHTNEAGPDGAGPTNPSEAGPTNPSEAGPPPACQTNADCGAGTPSCSSAHVCISSCNHDDDCASQVCNPDPGECAAEQDIVYAAPTGSDTAACTKSDPCSIGHAFAVAIAPRDTIKLGPGSYTYAAHVAVADGATLTVDGAGATWLAPAGAPALEVSGPGNTGGHGVVRVVGVSFTSTTADAVRCSWADLQLDQITIEAADTPIRVVFPTVCPISITRSSIRSHGSEPTIIAIGAMTIDRTVLEGGGGITAFGSSFSITNSVLANQTGPRLFTLSSLAEGGPGVADVSFSTIVNSAVACLHLHLRSSIVLNQSTGAPADTLTDLLAPGCSVSYTMASPQTTSLPGTGNVAGVDPALKDAAHGDYHLTAASPAVDAADPAAPVTVDLDGTPRPQGPNSDLGAFELQP